MKNYLDLNQTGFVPGMGTRVNTLLLTENLCNVIENAAFLLIINLPIILWIGGDHMKAWREKRYSAQRKSIFYNVFTKQFISNVEGKMVLLRERSASGFTHQRFTLRYINGRSNVLTMNKVDRVPPSPNYQ
jgi:hypothetical protein